MAIDESIRSRRALLAAAAGAASALAATAAAPAISLAADPNDVVKAVDNATAATTSITDTGADSTAFAGHANGAGYGYGLEGTAAAGAGMFAWSTSAPDWGDPPFEPVDIANTGVYGWAALGTGNVPIGAGIWGDSPDMGVFGTGSTGVQGVGGVAVAGFANETQGSIGILGIAGIDPSSYALMALGRVAMSRSGKKPIKSGKASVVVSEPEVTSASMVFAVLSTNEAGRWVRAVVPGSGQFTVYLNTTLKSAASVSWFVLEPWVI